MGPLSELTLEKAAAMVAVRAKIGHVKRAAGTPSFFDTLKKTTLDLSVPTIGDNAATGMPAHQHPGWGTYRDALLGAGAGAGLGAASSLLSSDKEKKKRWLQRMLQGGLLGGATVGGLSAAARFGGEFMGSTPTSVKPQADLEAARVRRDEAISRGQTPDKADVDAIAGAPDNPVTAKPRAGFGDRFSAGWDNITSGDGGRAMKGVGQIIDSPGWGAAGGVAGYGTGAVADRFANNSGVDGRVQTMPGPEMKKFLTSTGPAADAQVAHIRTHGLPAKGAVGPTMIPSGDAAALRANAPPGGNSRKFRWLGALLGATIPQLGGSSSTPDPTPAGVPRIQ